MEHELSFQQVVTCFIITVCLFLLGSILQTIELASY